MFQNPYLIPFFISAGSCCNTVQYNSILYITLNSGCHQCDEIRITNCTKSSKSKNFRCSQWRKFCQHDISFPALSSNRSRMYLLHVGLIIESRTVYVSNIPKKNFLYIYTYGYSEGLGGVYYHGSNFKGTLCKPCIYDVYLCRHFVTISFFPNVNNVHYSVVYFVLDHRWRRHNNDVETSPKQIILQTCHYLHIISKFTTKTFLWISPS